MVVGKICTGRVPGARRGAGNPGSRLHLLFSEHTWETVMVQVLGGASSLWRQLKPEVPEFVNQGGMESVPTPRGVRSQKHPIRIIPAASAMQVFVCCEND